MGNIPHIIEIALLLLVAFLIGCVIGWFFRTKIFRSSATLSKVEPVKQPEPGTASPALEPSSDAKTEPAKKAVSSVAKTESDGPVDADRPQGLSAPRDGGKDDLKKIKGVGPKLEGMLNGLGIYHFDQIAAWSRAEIDWVDDYLSFKGRIDRDDWIAQAKEFS